MKRARLKKNSLKVGKNNIVKMTQNKESIA